MLIRIAVEKSDHASELWASTVGMNFLQRFGLFDDDESYCLGFSDEQVADIKARNPVLANQQ